MEKNVRPICSKCASTNIYVWRDGSLVCRACGHVTREEKEEGGEI